MDRRSPCWFLDLLMNAAHDARSTVSHFPVGQEHLENAIETDRSSPILRVWEEQRLDAGFFSVAMHCGSPRGDKRPVMFCFCGTPAEIII